MTKTVVIGVILLSLVSVPILFVVKTFNLIKNEAHIFLLLGFGAIVCTGGTALLFHRYFRKVDPVIYGLALFSWTCVCSAALCLELEGYISKVMAVYVVEGEPYLDTAHGLIASLWDCTVHLPLIYTAIALYAHRESHREVTLYWAGSLLNSVVVLVQGAFIGPHKVKLAMLVNIAYVAVPFLIALKYLHRSPIQARSFIKFPPIWRRPVDLFFVVFFKLAALFVVFQLVTVLGGNASFMKDYLKYVDPYLKDANMFPKVQAVACGHFFLAYYVMTIYGLVFPGQHWMADWAIIFAGASAQAQFTHVAGALNKRTPKGLHPPTSGQAAIIYWTINILLFIVPHLFAFWCHRDPEKYGRTYTVDLASPLKTYVVKTVTTTSPRKSDYSQRKFD